MKDHVQQSIATHDDLKDVTVDVKGGVVRLTGTVPTEEDRLKAAVEARKAAGVRAVHDELRIRGGESRRSG
ncbi:MAG: BON domain-containing protein [Deltaproteobacteria bacterium]|nr:MAG: BON domain-containing protein [Deltaproteobacteria bacterium]